MVAPATGNSTKFPSKKFTKAFSHSSSIRLLASFTTSIPRVFSSKVLESFLIAEGKQLDVFTSNEDTL